MEPRICPGVRSVPRPEPVSVGRDVTMTPLGTPEQLPWGRTTEWGAGSSRGPRPRPQLSSHRGAASVKKVKTWRPANVSSHPENKRAHPADEETLQRRNVLGMAAGTRRHRAWPLSGLGLPSSSRGLPQRGGLFPAGGILG